jgi:membrane protein YqaA with SNARE-associated domain
MGWKEWVIDAFKIFGDGSLAAISFTEAIIQPLPPDVVYLPLLSEAMGDIPAVIWLWLVVTISSVLGSIVGYWIGGRWGNPLMERFAKPKHVSKLIFLSEKYGTAGVFIAAFSPIPYKVFGWVAGMTNMDKKSFVVAGLAGRGLRFGVEALLIGFYGAQAFEAMIWFLDNEIWLAIALIFTTIITWYGWVWWNGLGEEIPNLE